MSLLPGAVRNVRWTRLSLIQNAILPTLRVGTFISDSPQLSLTPFKYSSCFKCLIMTAKPCLGIKTWPCRKENNATWSASPVFRVLTLLAPCSEAADVFITNTLCPIFTKCIIRGVHACCYVSHDKPARWGRLVSYFWRNGQKYREKKTPQFKRLFVMLLTNK